MGHWRFTLDSILFLFLSFFILLKPVHAQVPFGPSLETRPLATLKEPTESFFETSLKELLKIKPGSITPVDAIGLYILIKNGDGTVEKLLEKMHGPITSIPDDPEGMVSRTILYSLISGLKGREEYKKRAVTEAESLTDLVYNKEEGEFIGKDGTIWSRINSLAIIALFINYHYTGNKWSLKMGKEMIDHFKETFLFKKKGVATGYIKGVGPLGDGDLAENVLGAFAFKTAYDKIGDGKYIEEARDIIDFMIKRLYDPLLGGFFKRNSEETLFEGEPLLISDKPYHLNALVAYIISELDVYREAYLATINLLEKVWDKMDYGERIAFLGAYRVELHKKKKEEGPESLLLGKNILILAILSFLAGVLSFTSPCTLPILPAYFAYTFQSDRKRILLMTFAFFLGLSLVFSLMGATATLIGSFLRSRYGLLLKIGGVIIIVMGILSFVGKGFSGFQFKNRPSTSFLGSFLFGCALAVGWTACVGPILAGILVLASTQEGALTGPLLLFIYAMGLSLPLIILSTLFHRLDKEGLFWRIIRGKGWEITIFGRVLHLHTNNIVAGSLFIALGILMATGYLTYLNRALPIEIQVWFADVEEWLLSLFK